MLFSNEEVVSAIEEKFEPIWVSLRPVPRLTIDFGNGNVVRRTLHGNVATWVCASDGTALDVLPGIYEPQVWIQEMSELAQVHENYVAMSNTDPGDFLVNYHESSLTENDNVVYFSETTEAISGLHADTVINESHRRKTIHRFMLNQVPSTPDVFTPWLYREVLNADLEDPYLGLGDALFGSYPFADEDAN